MTMPVSHCPDRRRLYAEYAPLTGEMARLQLDEIRMHTANCQRCRLYLAKMAEYAELAVHPEIAD